MFRRLRQLSHILRAANAKKSQIPVLYAQFLVLEYKFALQLIIPQHSHKHSHYSFGDDIVDARKLGEPPCPKGVEGYASHPYEHVAQSHILLLESEGVEHPAIVNAAIY